MFESCSWCWRDSGHTGCGPWGTEELLDPLLAVCAAGRGAPVGSTTSLLELDLSEPLSLSVNWGFGSMHPGVDEDETG